MLGDGRVLAFPPGGPSAAQTIQSRDLEVSLPRKIDRIVIVSSR